MATLMHDSIAGYAIRFLTNGRIFQYAEERDPSLWKRFINIEKSGQMARQGLTEPGDKSEEDSLSDSLAAQIPSVAWSDQGNTFQGLTGARIDTEKGKDVHLVDWWDDHDKEVCRPNFNLFTLDGG